MANFHTLDQAMFEGVTVTNVPIIDNFFFKVTHHLMHINDNSPEIIRMESNRFNVRTNTGPLSCPIFADGVRSLDETAFKSFRPSHVRGHRGKGAVDISRVEGSIGSV